MTTTDTPTIDKIVTRWTNHFTDLKARSHANVEPGVRARVEKMTVDSILDEIAATPAVRGHRKTRKAVLVDRLVGYYVRKAWNDSQHGQDAQRVAWLRRLIERTRDRRAANVAEMAEFAETVGEGFRRRGYDWAAADVWNLMRNSAELDLIERVLSAMGRTLDDDLTGCGMLTEIEARFAILSEAVTLALGRHLDFGPEQSSGPHRFGSDAEYEGHRRALKELTSVFEHGRDVTKVRF